MSTVTHATAATGVDSGDGKISKNAWNEDHTVTGPLFGSTAPDSGDQGWFYFRDAGSARYLYVNIGSLAVPNWQTLTGLRNAGETASVRVNDSGLVGISGSGATAALEIDIGPSGHIGADILTGTASPSAGAGVFAPVPALYLRDNSGVGELWLKVGSLDTQWTKIL